MKNDNNAYGWTVPDKESVNKYINKCRLFVKDNEAFSNFRRDPDYTKVLEGGQKIVGTIHLKRIKEKFGLNELIKDIDKFKENDIYGNPIFHNYPEIGEMNPCTILYVSQALDIKELLGDFIPKKIVEVGGGFGALCKTLSVLYSFDEYILIDLPDIISLCKKYLKNFPELFKKVTFIDCEDLKKIESIKDVDLFIAIASLSECDEETQNIYVDKIVMNSLYSYIIYNTTFISGYSDVFNRFINKFVTDFEGTIEPSGDVKIVELRKNQIK